MNSLLNSLFPSCRDPEDLHGMDGWVAFNRMELHGSTEKHQFDVDSYRSPHEPIESK